MADPAGTWRLSQTREPATASLTVTPLHPLARDDGEAVLVEGERLLAVAVPGAASREARLGAATAAQA